MSAASLLAAARRISRWAERTGTPGTGSSCAVMEEGLLYVHYLHTSREYTAGPTPYSDTIARGSRRVVLPVIAQRLAASDTERRPGSAGAADGSGEHG